MGIERIAAPVSQAQRQTIRGNISEDDIVELAGSRETSQNIAERARRLEFPDFAVCSRIDCCGGGSPSKDGHALPAEESDPAADHDKGKNQVAPASDQDQAAGGAKAADETGGDQPGSSGLAGLGRNAPRDSDLPREENAKPAAHASALDPPAADGGAAVVVVVVAVAAATAKALTQQAMMLLLSIPSCRSMMRRQAGRSSST